MVSRPGRLRRTRRSAAAAVAGIGVALLVAGWSGRAAAGPLPPLSSPPLSLPTPSLPLPTLPLPTLPVPTPTLSGPLPSLPGLPTPPPVGSAPPPAGVAQPGVPPGSASAPGATATSPSGSAGAVPAFGVQSSVLAALLGLLGTPPNVGVEKPSLAHFSLDSSHAAGQVGPDSGSSVALWGLAGLCLLALLASALVWRHRGRLTLTGAAAAVSLMVVAAAMTAAAGSTMPARAPAGSSTGRVLTTTAQMPAPATSDNRLTGAILFNRLALYEAQIAATEAQMQSPSTAAGTAERRQEAGLASTLETTIQHEYDFVAATASDPTRSAALMQAASTRPAKVKDVVSYDVQAVQAELAQQAAIDQAARAAAPRGATAPVGASGTPAQLAWPLNGVITQGFGETGVAVEPALTIGGVTYPHFHTGLDISSALGTPVRAAADGVVALAGAQTDELGHLVGYGNYVVIAHGGNMITLYGHLEQLLVRPGEAVHTGDPIGLEGSTGNSTGPHVHFEVRIGGVVTDPTTYLAPRPT